MILEEMSSPLRAAAVLASALACYVITTVIYRLYFHPLAAFPGPFWAKISGFPAYLHTLRKDRHIWFWQLEQRYGTSFRFTPDDVLINTPTGFKQIFNNKANVGKADYYRAYPRIPEAITTWNTTDKNIHARKRRVMGAAFSDKALRSAEPFVHENVDRWCQLIEQEIDNNGEWSKSLNMARWADHLIFDILGSLCFGKSFGMKEPDSKLRYVPGLMIDFLQILHPIAYSPFTSFWIWLKPRGLNSLLALSAPPALSNWTSFVEKCFKERSQVEDSLKSKASENGIEVQKDFFHYLFRAVDPETGKGYSSQELFGESESLIIAGSDTTAISTAAAMFYLSRNDSVQMRLAAEIRGAFATKDQIKGGNLLQSDCKYLQAFIKEILRMSPPVPADLAREVLRGGLSVDDYFLPQGVRVSTCSFCLHHNKDLYAEPFAFRPERWIVGEEGSTEESVALADSGYMPFSGGPRGCVGKNLAYLEMSIVIAKIIHQFEIRKDESSNLGGGSPDFIEGRRVVDQFQLYDSFVGIRDGPLVQLKRRE